MFQPARSSSPLLYAFFGSLLLSAISIYGTELPNRDGMLYIETASIFLDEGFSAAKANFDWVFFPICIAVFSKITGLGLEAAAYMLNTLLFAGVCATVVRIAQVQFPRFAWYACLVVLSLPAFNEQRNEIIRETGWWLFCLQALLAAWRWQCRPNYRNGLFVQGLLLLACFFRVEGIIFFASLALWQLLARISWRQRLERLKMLLSAPLLAGMFLLAALGTGYIDAGNRLATYASAANPVVSLASFEAVAEQFGKAILSQAPDDAGSILFLGLIATVIKKFIGNNGLLLIPAALFLWNRTSRRHFADWQPQAQFFFVYLLTLIAFVIHNLFISSRHVIFLNILTIPLIAVGLRKMFAAFSRWRLALMLVLLIAALANVISLSARKTQFREAGRWLAARQEMIPVTYIEDSRIRYCAGAAFWIHRKDVLSRDAIAAAIGDGRLDYLVIYAPSRNTADIDWARSLALEESVRFSNETGNAVIVFQRKISP